MSIIDAPRRAYHIAEVARRSGFTPATLRYYEKAGVLAAPARTASGYRVYDERALERLQLISRAKELGCTLEEITDLVQVWDADECAPVKHRLLSLVQAKVAEVRRRIDEQVAFAAQLEATASSLVERPRDGACDDACGCATATATSTAMAEPVGVAANERGGNGPPVACSLSSGETAGRLEEWQAVLAAVQHRRRLDGGVRLEFGPDAPLEQIGRLAAAEYDCCPFFAFALTVDGRGIALEVTAPTDGQVIFEEVFGAGTATDDVTDEEPADGRV